MSGVFKFRVQGVTTSEQIRKLEDRWQKIMDMMNFRHLGCQMTSESLAKSYSQAPVEQTKQTECET
ncbi:hypothetical protein KIN20_009841 [Parelaphostrongylus tenuis]|uniref:Uncharacterized protein n=1 Tax=Parelaphostrongylus tenuis TaxID=148309 RepID=A0AAD5QJY0_PARTN|nr:hypothetical protein KIN20_009841 [Parelaphostrongylus tenuis]